MLQQFVEKYENEISTSLETIFEASCAYIAPKCGMERNYTQTRLIKVQQISETDMHFRSLKSRRVADILLLCQIAYEVSGSSLFLRVQLLVRTQAH